MQRIFDTTAAAALPATPTLAGTPGYFTEGSPGSSAATLVRAWWMNMIQEELMSLLAAGGITPDTTGTTFNQVLQSLQKLARIKAMANTTIYVATNGSDNANTGLSAGSPFATLQHAIDTVYGGYDWNGFQATISLANGTYNAAALMTGQPIGHNKPVLIIGNTGSPSSVLLSVTSGNAFQASIGAFVTINGVQVQATGASGGTVGQGYGIVSNQAWININNVILGACGSSQITATGSGVVTNNGNPVTFTGGSVYGLLSTASGLIWLQNATITLTGTPPYSSAFASAQANATIEISGNTFAGSATGPRYFATQNGVINSTAATLPGSSAGSTSAGGQFL